MAGVSKLEEVFSDDDSSSFWTTPADDIFRFSNLSPSYMSVLKESGPFVAVVLSCWDNVLGPRLQHVWRGNGDTESQVKLDISDSILRLHFSLKVLQRSVCFTWISFSSRSVRMSFVPVCCMN